MKNTKALASSQSQDLLNILQKRFDNNTQRHPSLDWPEIEARLQAQPDKMWSLYQMENTGGEPDVISYYSKTDTFTFCDCSAESPKDRRSLCYDREGLESRKEHKPKNSAIDMATEMGIELLSQEQYRQLQQLGDFDSKTSSWLLTPDEIRKHGGAIFGDFRYEHVFVYHNGAQSYYAARGFRGWLKV